MPIDRIDCELISRLPDRDTGKPPLLFIHGALAGAWCWEDHWLPAAAARGWPAYALSLRGHGASPGREHIQRFGLRHYVADVLHAAQSLPRPPVLIGHSMGGLIVQRCLQRIAAPAGVLVASVGARGGWDIALSILRRSPLDFLKLATNRGRSPLLKRRYSFADHVPEETVRRCRTRLGPESKRVQYEIVVPRRARPVTTPLLVIGAANDALISQRTVQRTAHALKAEVMMFSDLGHNLMLEPGWRRPLDAMLDWLEPVVMASGDQTPRSLGDE